MLNAINFLWPKHQHQVIRLNNCFTFVNYSAIININSFVVIGICRSLLGSLCNNKMKNVSHTLGLYAAIRRRQTSEWEADSSSFHFLWILIWGWIEMVESSGNFQTTKQKLFQFYVSQWHINLIRRSSPSTPLSWAAPLHFSTTREFSICQLFRHDIIDGSFINLNPEPGLMFSPGKVARASWSKDDCNCRFRSSILAFQ